MKALIYWSLSLLILATGAWGHDKAAIIYGKAGKMDMMVNQNVAMMGVKPYIEEHQRAIFELEPQYMAMAKKAVHELVAEEFNPIIFIGNEYTELLQEVALQYPEQHFVIIDAIVDLPNVKSAVFAEHEGSFLVGAAASLVSRNQKLGFIGGMDSPMVRKYSCGFAQGAKYINEQTEVDIQMAGLNKAGFKKPELGERLANEQIERGVDIIYQVAGHTHIGVFNAIEQHDNVYGIGSTNNQNWMRPGHILTSMVKHAGMVTRNILEDTHDGNWTAGVHTYGLAGGGIDWAQDEFNRDLLPETVNAELQTIKQAIVDGRITVHNYVTDQHCPV